MAIYHLSHGMVSRSTGRSSVQSAAYITGEQLYESRRDIDVNYQNRHSDIAFTNTLAPEHAPESFRDTKVWDLLEKFEDEYAVKRFPYNLEAREKYQDSAQTAQTIVMALPRELSVDVAKELVEEFAKERFVSRNLIVTYAIHDDEGNPHAHLQISRRAVNLDGTLAWAKDRAICSRKELLVTRKLWADLTNNYLMREGYEARITEKSFADLGINLEPSKHRGWVADKLKEMGITSRIITENIKSFENNREEILENPSVILNEITSKTATFSQIDLLKTIQKRVGDDDKLVASAFKRALSDAVVVGEGLDGNIRYTSEAYLQIENQAITQIANLFNKPHSTDNTTGLPRTFGALNDGAGRDSIKLDGHSPLQGFAMTGVKEFLKNNYSYLSQEQSQAVLGLTEDGSQCSVLIGRAGAGKTTTLKAVADIYRDVGYKVVGASLSAMAADNLERETGIESKTLHSLVYALDKYKSACDKFLSFDAIVDEGVLKQLDWYQDLKKYEKFALTNKHVVVVDEAGMVGTRQWQELLTHIANSGAKLIAAGDDNQFKAIEAGDFFREIKNQAGEHNQLFSLNEIRRQKTDWMIKASANLAELNISEGLSAYEQHGYVHQTSNEYLAKDIAEAYVWQMFGTDGSGNQSEQSKDNARDGLVLAFTNAQTKEINSEIRSILKNQGVISKQDQITIEGKKFTLGDKIVFLENDKTRLRIYDKDGVIQGKQFIKNGTQGTIESVNDKGDVKVALKDGLFTEIKCEKSTKSEFIELDPNSPKGLRDDMRSSKNSYRFKGFQDGVIIQTKYNYTKIAHGYAVTTHKAQGQTVDFTIVAASKNMDAKALYVAMTRHRHDVQLFYTSEDFKTFKALTSHLSRFEHKDLVKDYTIRPENEQSWQRVQEYKLAVLDAASIIKEGKGNSESIDWDIYRKIKTDQIRLGKEILGDFKIHELYINQASLTREMLEISTGSKARQLSFIEEKARLTVELYGETAQVTRDLWLEIRQTHPGSKCYEHSKYGEFSELRDERNSLAHTILENYGLHREFVGEFTKAYGINKKTIEAQSKQFIATQQEKLNSNLSTHNIDEKESNLWYNIELYNQSYGKYNQVENNYSTNKANVYRDNLQTQQTSKNSNNYQNQNHIDYALIKQELNSKIKDLAYEFLGKPQQQKATEWRYGNKGSISIHVAGHKQGLYSNFETGESGNSLKLIQDHRNLDYKQAFKWGMDWLGHKDHQFIQQGVGELSPQAVNQLKNEFTQVLPAQSKSEWTPLFPASNQAPNLKDEKQLAYMLKGKQETARFTYKDADHNVLGYVIRLEDKDGNKITPTLTYCRDSQGKEQWRWQGFGNDRPLYGLEQLREKPTSPVLIVEGEKTCDAARLNRLFKDMAVVTWNGGAAAVQKSDWSVLKDKTVIVWPDNDNPGLNAANKISKILKAQGNQNVSIVDLPATLPHKWDLADKVPDGVKLEEVLKTAEKSQQIEANKNLVSPSKPQLSKNTILKIAHDFKLDKAFGAVSDNDYQKINAIYDVFISSYKQLGVPIGDGNLTKRSVYVGCQIKHPSVGINIDENLKMRACLLASQEFAKHNNLGIAEIRKLQSQALSRVKVNDNLNEPAKSISKSEEIFGSQISVQNRQNDQYLQTENKIISTIQNLQKEHLKTIENERQMQRGKGIDM
jgi:5S rRNA maturation endonuclease (ribonuclease M5)